MSKIDLNKQAKEILSIAEKYGVEQNFFFLTTFKRYQVQIGILNDLERTIREGGTLIIVELLYLANVIAFIKPSWQIMSGFGDDNPMFFPKILITLGK